MEMEIDVMSSQTKPDWLLRAEKGAEGKMSFGRSLKYCLLKEQMAKLSSLCGSPRKTRPSPAGVNQNPQLANLSQVENPLTSEPPTKANSLLETTKLHKFQTTERLQI